MEWGVVVGLIGISIGVIGVIAGAMGWAYRIGGLTTKVGDLTEAMLAVSKPLRLIGERLAKVEVTLLDHGRRVTKLENHEEKADE